MNKRKTSTVGETAMNKQHRQILRKLTAVPTAVALFAFPTLIHAADVSWVGGNGSGGSPGDLNDAANWSSVPPSVPGPVDSVFFANSGNTHLTTTADLTNASASFGGTANNYYMRLDSEHVWTLTDSLTVSMSSGSFWRVVSGTVQVTNENGTATATFGGADPGNRGSLHLDGGTLIVDQLNITGASGSASNRGLTSNSGRLDVLNGSTITTPQTLQFGTLTDSTFTANFLGGENQIAASVWIGGSGRGVVTVDGADTTLSVIGTAFIMGANPTGSGDNEFTVSGGAEVTSNALVLIGNNAAQPGNTMTVTGAGSSFEATDAFSLGDLSSDNQLIVSAGGSVHVAESKNTYIGQGADASGNILTVTGQNSLFQTGTVEGGSYIAVGLNGDDNQLVVTDGGRVSTYRVTAGFNAGATGNSVTVTNGGILEVAHTLSTDNSISNTITVSNGGVLQFTTASPNITTNNGVGGAITLGEGGIVSFIGISDAPTAALTDLTYSGGSHILRLDNAQNASVVNQTFGSSGTYSSLELKNGGIWNSTGALNIGDEGKLVGDGTVNGAVTVESGGLLAIGQSPGTMIFNSDLTLSEGSLSTFGIDGLTAGFYDMALGGIGTQGVTFGGTLDLVFASDFSALGSVQIFDFENYTGDFTTVNTSGLASGYFAQFDSSNGVVTINAIPEPKTWVLAGIGLGLAALRVRRRIAVQ